MDLPPPSSPPDHLSPPVSSPSSETEEQLFIEDDLEFRTVTTLLALLESREKVTLDNFKVTDELRPYLKMLTSFSSLLVRHHEILVILPKRSASGTELFLSTQGEPSGGDELSPSSPSPPSSPLSPLSSPSSLHHFLTRNPRNDDPLGGPVELLDIPDINVGTDILSFIVANWNQSFDHHVKVFETLLNISLAKSSSTSKTAWSNLKSYSFFQSIGKVEQRFYRSDSIKRLHEIDPLTLKPPSDHLSLTKADNGSIHMIFRLFRGADPKEIYPALFTFVYSEWPPEIGKRSPEDPALFLTQFHELFKRFLTILSKELSDLAGLRKQQNPPEKLLSRDISVARRNIGVLRYFAWVSDFFVVYIRTILNSLADAHQVAIDAEETGVPEEKIGSSERDMDGEEEDRLDIATEFETDKGPQAETPKPPLVGQFMSQLRLITSNVQHLDFLQGGRHKLKGLRMRFRILKYPRSDNKLKPWREVITGLFNEETAQQVIEALCEKSQKKSAFKTFLPGGPVLHFKGQAHCEAVLGCLYTLANGGDTTWTTIPTAPPNLLQTIKYSHNLLAPSKRCCPVCATIIDLLSATLAGRNRPPLQALSRHSIIFPCALPYGLPRDIRVELLKKYKAELKNRLLALAKKGGRVSESSGQSEPVSLDEREDDIEYRKINEELAEDFLEELGELQGEEKERRWEEMLERMDGEARSLCWSLMEESVRVGLRSPAEGEMKKG